MVLTGLLALLALFLTLAGGCASLPDGPPAYDYFRGPAASDPWSRKIERWQVRERSDPTPDAQRGPAAVAEGRSAVASPTGSPGDLREEFERFRVEHRRELAREVARWIQEQARSHYIPDGPIDRWATLAETLRQNGDDCDGLELLAFHLLRDLGFHEGEVYRAIVYRRSDGQHHMVTLWFEERGDPWVIDPTGAMIAGMPRISQVPDWVPIKIFSETQEFTVRGPGLDRAATRISAR
jgi:predicted transglutaminase-like cysteine proteinase